MILLRRHRPFYMKPDSFLSLFLQITSQPITDKFSRRKDFTAPYRFSVSSSSNNFRTVCGFARPPVVFITLPNSHWITVVFPPR
jgi:hypothetical protein